METGLMLFSRSLYLCNIFIDEHLSAILYA